VSFATWVRSIYQAMVDVPGGADGDDLVVMVAAAVVRDAVRIGGSLVVPDTATLTLPAAEHDIVSSGQVHAEFTQAVRADVRRRAEVVMARGRRDHAHAAAIVGAEALHVLLVRGSARAVRTGFSGGIERAEQPLFAPAYQPTRVPAHTSAPVPAVFGSDPGLTRPHPTPGTTSPDRVGLTVADASLRLVLTVDGHVAGSVPVGGGRVDVGRHHGCNLVVPEEQDLVSRQALTLVRSGLNEVEVTLRNRNGAWIVRSASAERRQRLSAGDVVRVGAGDVLLLTEDSAVELRLEGA
jgi:hypothetical protein